MSQQAIAEGHTRVVAICPNCKTRWQMLQSLAGKRVSCANCQTAITVPGGEIQDTSKHQQTTAANGSGTKPLFSAQQIFGATVLGTPLAGGTLLALNQMRLGQKTGALLAFAGTLVALVVVIAILVVLVLLGMPPGIGMVVGIGFALVMKPVAADMFRLEYQIREQEEIAPPRNLESFGIALAWAAAWIGFTLLMNYV